MLPEVSLKILKALQKKSLESKKIILDWSFVLETVKQKVKETQLLDGYDLYLMLCLLNDYSLVSSNIILCTSKILYIIFERMFCLLSFLNTNKLGNVYFWAVSKIFFSVLTSKAFGGDETHSLLAFQLRLTIWL